MAGVEYAEVYWQHLNLEETFRKTLRFSKIYQNFQLIKYKYYELKRRKV